MIMEKLQQEHGIPSERIVSMRFDSMDYEDMTAKDMFKAVKEKLNLTGRTYLFLDEVQEIEGWEKVVNSLATDYDVDLFGNSDLPDGTICFLPYLYAFVSGISGIQKAVYTGKG